jgi:hypothetical protein
MEAGTGCHSAGSNSFQACRSVVKMGRSSLSGVGASGNGENADLLAFTSLPEWVVRALADNGVRRLSEVSAMSDEELLSLRGVGKRSVRLIRLAIVAQRRRIKLGLVKR